MTNAELSALLTRLATQFIVPPGTVSKEEAALMSLALKIRRSAKPFLADESTAQPDPAPLRLWVSTPLESMTPAFNREQKNHPTFCWSADKPAANTVEIPVRR